MLFYFNGKKKALPVISSIVSVNLVNAVTSKDCIMSTCEVAAFPLSPLLECIAFYFMQGTTSSVL